MLDTAHDRPALNAEQENLRDKFFRLSPLPPEKKYEYWQIFTAREICDPPIPYNDIAEKIGGTTGKVSSIMTVIKNTLDAPEPPSFYEKDLDRLREAYYESNLHRPQFRARNWEYFEDCILNQPPVRINDLAKECGVSETAIRVPILDIKDFAEQHFQCDFADLPEKLGQQTDAPEPANLAL